MKRVVLVTSVKMLENDVWIRQPTNHRRRIIGYMQEIVKKSLALAVLSEMENGHAHTLLVGHGIIRSGLNED